MAISIFAAFRSTVTPPNEKVIKPSDQWLVDPATGAIIGVQSRTANGADARFTPVDITAAQLANPPASMLADLDATYRLNVAPYSRYQSDGSQIVPMSGSGGIVVPVGTNLMYYAPWTISAGQEVVVEGTIRVISYPA